MPSIAFITTCKARLHHLKETLPLMAGQQPDELIVVDYSCPEQTGDWVEAEFPQAKVVRVPGEQGFNLSKARNHGAAAAASEWLFFLDADLRPAPTMVSSLRKGIEPGKFYLALLRAGSDPWELHGSFCCRREDFLAAGGYDEVIAGWGYEDLDLYERLKLLGIEQSHYAKELASSIPHDDSERDVASDMSNREENEAVNGCYSHAKRAISIHRGGKGNLPLDERRRLLEGVRKLVKPWYAEGRGKTPLTVRFLVGNAKARRLSWPLEIGSQTTVTVTLAPSPPPRTRPGTFRR